jgi:hypothetical protein
MRHVALDRDLGRQPRLQDLIARHEQSDSMAQAGEVTRPAAQMDAVGIPEERY